MRPYAHCEYDSGFLIFDRRGQGKEVWRLASQYDRSPAPPEELQADVQFTINEFFPPSKGYFRPWAVLTVPQTGRAFRFVYPTLAVVGTQNAYLYDIPTCELVKTIPNLQIIVHGETLGEINYVEVDSNHVYVCGSIQLRIFDRTSGALIFSISSTHYNIVDRGITVQPRPESIPTGSVTVCPLIAHRGTLRSRRSTTAEFVAGRFTPNNTLIRILQLAHDLHGFSARKQR